MNTLPLEADTRTLINKNLENLGWNLEGVNKNVFQEQPRTEEERKKLGGKRPDYVLYSKEVDSKPLIIIEAKKKGERIDNALEQGIHYAKELDAPIVFATDGLFCKSYHTKFEKTPILNGEEVDEFLREALALKYLNTWEVNTVSPKVQYDRKELIKIFDEANNMLRGDGLRAGIERFGEFANILFLKLISESEDNKKLAGIESKFDTMCHWDYIKDLNPNSRIEHINKIVYERLNNLYKTDIFTPLSIRDTSILNEIMKKIDPLTLTDVDSDIKGDAFEYFLKESTATKNDLGEYFTPRHIVKTMVKLVNPQIGEKIYDPFCGTGGFLIESFRHIWNTMPRNDTTINMLHNDTIYGNEITNTARITKMNMILAGDGHNGIEMKDSLASPIHGKYDIVLANMPYSQKTRYGNLYDLPSTNGDSICVQHCMKAISSTSDNGRMALVVPEGFLFSKNLSKTRELLLNNCELQSIISLPQGVFLPYTGVKTNIIYATKINQKTSTKNKKKNFWYFEVKSDGYTLDSHRRKLENTKNDLDVYQEYRKFDNNPKQEMLDVGFNLIPIDKVKENDFILVGNKYKQNALLDNNYDKTKLSEICDLVIGYSFKSSDYIENSNTLVVRMSCIKPNGNADLEYKPVFLPDSYVEKYNKFLLQKGDIIIAMTDMAKEVKILGLPTIIPESNKKLLLNQRVGKFININYDKIDKKFLMYILRADYIKQYFKSLGTGALQINVSRNDILNIEIPLPILEQQQDIVKELDNYQQIIDGAKLISENYKQTIQIKKEWKKTTLKEVVLEIKSGFACGKNDNNNDNLVHLRPMNITTNGEFTLEGSKFITSDILEQKQAYLLKAGDILFNNTNSKELVGKTCYIDKDLIAVYSNHMTRIRVNTDKVIPQFLSIYLHNKWREGYFLEKCKKWIGQAGIDMQELSSMPLYLPSLNEQNEIIQKINQEQKLIKPTKELIETFTQKIQDKINELFN